MNKIFKTKYNHAKGEWVACPEITGNRGKTKNTCLAVAVATLFGSVITPAMAAECTSWEMFRGVGSCEISQTTERTVDVGNGAAVLTMGRAGVTNNILVDVQTDLTLNGNATKGPFHPKGISINGGDAGEVILTATDRTININIKQLPTADSDIPTIGMNVIGGGKFKGKNLNINTETHIKRGSEDFQSYGLGIGNASGDEYRGNDISSVTVENATINVSNTEGTTGAYQMAGIRAIRGSHWRKGETSTPYFESTGDVNINVRDNSTAKSGNYLVGIYLSGGGGKVVLNNSSITVQTEAAGAGRASSAVKIGKYRDVGTGAGTIESKGKLVWDTTAVKDAPTIRIINDQSSLIADFEGSSGEIKSAATAIDFASADLISVPASNQKALFRNTKITTLNEKADQKNTSALINLNQGKEATADWFFTIPKKTSSASFELKGNDSSAHASDYGWLFNVEKNAQLTVNNSDKGNMTGLSKLALNNAGNPDESELKVNLDNGFTWNLNKKQAADASAESTTATVSSLNLSNLSTLNGAYDEAGNNNYTLKAVTADGSKGSVISDKGIITLANAQYTDKLTIDGNYEGKNDAVLKMNTLWNDPGDVAIEGGADSVSDVLHILGTASGMTTVIPVDQNNQDNFIDGNVTFANATDDSKTIIKEEDVSIAYPNATLKGKKVTRKTTINTLPVVIVEQGNVAEQSNFKGTAQTTGLGEVFLTYQDKDNGVRNYYWTASLESTSTSYKMVPLEPGIPTPPPPTPTPPAPPTPPTPPTPIYKPSIPGLVITPKINIEQGFMTLGSLHQRRGDNFPLLWDSCGCLAKKADNQAWGRILGAHTDFAGKTRFDGKARHYGFQVGYDDLNFNAENKTRTHTGVFAGFIRSDAKFYDRNRVDRNHYEQTGNLRIADNKYAGKGKADNLHLGLSHTRYAKNGSYIDLVGQIGFSRNTHYPDGENSATQKGYSLAASVEVGRPYMIGERKANESKWVIEPQAQLSYQMLHLNGFSINDNTKADSVKHHALRGRIGARLSHYSNNHSFTDTLYGIANVYHDFTSNGKTSVGGESVSEQFSRTWGEIGAGLDLPVSKQGRVYADIRYEHNLDSLRRRNIVGSVGYKLTW